MITIIAAHASNGIIGSKGGIPWRLPKDLAWFKKHTMGHHVVMGRKTWESLPESKLPGRTTHVITSSPQSGDIKADYAWDSLWHPLLGAELDNEEIFIIGGQAIYQDALKYPGHIDRIILTKIHRVQDGDTYLPDGIIDLADTFIHSYAQLQRGKDFDYGFNIYNRR